MNHVFRDKHFAHLILPFTDREPQIQTLPSCKTLFGKHARS